MSSTEYLVLMQFAREPVYGRVKTRMQPVLSAEQSLALHRYLVRRVFMTLRDCQLAAIEVWVAGETTDALFQELQAGGASLHLQRGENLGARMRDALADGLQRAEKVILVGSDCVSLTTEYLHAAIAALDDHDLVFGPALDGGYVLIGMTGALTDVFEDIPWGSDQVMQYSRERCMSLGTAWEELDALADIDRPEDLVQISVHEEGRELLAQWREAGFDL